MTKHMRQIGIERAQSLFNENVTGGGIYISSLYPWLGCEIQGKFASGHILLVKTLPVKGKSSNLDLCIYHSHLINFTRFSGRRK